ncbi:MAG: DUF2341 domain-containing protein [Candidatus Buchananbacteria bacterium]
MKKSFSISIKITSLVFLSLFIFSNYPVAAQASWLSGWQYRKEITVAKTNVDSELTNFPLLVKIAGDTDIGAGVSDGTNGYDLRFTDSSGNLLAYERENFSVLTGSASGNFWVKVPTVNSSSDPLATTIYIYYGNSGAVSSDWTTSTSALTNCTSITNSQCVWKEGASQNFVGVWHLGQTGTNPTAIDSTASANNSATQTWSPTTTAQIVSAGEFNGSSNSINVTSNDGLNPAAITVSGWVKADVNNKWQYPALKGGQWNFGRDIDGKYYLGVWSTGGLVADEHSTTTASTGTWEYIAFTYNSSLAKYYVGTTLVIDKVVTGNLATTTAALTIGSQSGTGNFWDGLIDDLKISNTARSAGWLKFEYFNQSSASNELTFAASESSVDATLSNLTISSGTLSPSFASSTATYTASVDSNISSVTVTPTVTQSDATITVNGTAVTSGAASGSISLSYGSNTISTVVTAADGTTTGTYTLTVTRATPNYTLTYSADSHGSITGSASQTVAQGSNGSAVTAVPDAGYRFTSWSDGSTDNPRTDNNVTADGSFSANFTVISAGGAPAPAPAIGIGINDVGVTVNIGGIVNVGPITADGTNVLTYITNQNNFTAPESSNNWQLGSHSFQITDLNLANNIVTIVFSSKPQTIILKKGESQQIDFDGDKINDVRVIFSDVVINRVEITVVSLAQTSPITNDIDTAALSQSTKFIFKKNLTLGAKGNDVKELQKFLNQTGFIVAKTGAGSQGKETINFGPATKAALIKFQKVNNITPAVGYFGPVTRGVVNR